LGGRRGNLSVDPRKILFPPRVVPVCGSTLQLSRLTNRHCHRRASECKPPPRARRRTPPTGGRFSPPATWRQCSGCWRGTSRALPSWRSPARLSSAQVLSRLLVTAGV